MREDYGQYEEGSGQHIQDTQARGEGSGQGEGSPSPTCLQILLDQTQELQAGSHLF